MVAIACLLPAACGSGGDSDLDERVAELQEENESLRAQLEAQQASTSTAQGSVTTTTANTDGSTTSSSSTTTVVVPTTAVAPPPGTRENPRPLGEPVPAGDWTYTVLAFEPNVDPLVAQLSTNNEPAGEGMVYSRLRLQAVYTGQRAGDPGRLTVNLVSPTGTIIGEASPCCEPQRDALTDRPEIFPNAAVEGWIYYAVPAADLFAGPFVAFDPDAEAPNVPDGIVFFRVN